VLGIDAHGKITLGNVKSESDLLGELKEAADPVASVIWRESIASSQSMAELERWVSGATCCVCGAGFEASSLRLQWMTILS
jgi:hypothetical protein